MTDVRNVAIVGGAAVAIIAMLTGNDGQAIAAFFGLLAGLGLGKMQHTAEQAKRIADAIVEAAERMGVPQNEPEKT